MEAIPINYLAVLVSAIIMMVVGFLWHGPVFGKQWAKLQNFTPEQMAKAQQGSMAWRILSAFVGWLVMSYVLAHALIFASAYLKTSGVSAGWTAGFWNWLGFIAPVTLGVVLWEGKSWKLWLINNGYYAIGLMLMGSILAVWK